MRVALYARVSTSERDHDPETRLLALEGLLLKGGMGDCRRVRRLG